MSNLIQTRPSFSIVVPTYRRPERLAACLRGLAALDYPKTAYEILIVDDGSDPGTARQVEASGGASGVATRYLSQAHLGPAKARNAGSRAARGRYLAFTDDDCVPAPGWLTEMERTLETDPTAIVGGLTLNALPHVLGSAASQLLVDFLYEYHHVELTGARFFTSNNVAVAADRFLDAGGFDETFPLAAGEDRELCERWQRLGGSLRFAAGAVVHHWHHLTVRKFARQHFNYGRGAHYLHKSRSRGSAETGTAVRPKLEPLAFYARLVTYPLGRVEGWRAAPLAGMMGLSQAAYVTGYLFQRAQRL